MDLLIKNNQEPHLHQEPHLNLFGHSQKQNLMEILKGLTTDHVIKFVTSELKRLKNTPIVDFQDIPPPDFFLTSDAQKKKVDQLIEQGRLSNGVIDLNQDNFFSLINEYSTSLIRATKTRKFDISEEQRSEIDEAKKRAFNQIGGLINKSKDSLGWLSIIILEKDSNQTTYLARFIHELCHLGDSKTLETVIEKLGDNFRNLLNLIPYSNEEAQLEFSALSIENTMMVINKRINHELKFPNNDAEKWINIKRIFDHAISLEQHLDGLSISYSSEARSIASLARRLVGDSPARRLDDSPSRRLDDSSQNVAKSGPVAGARGDGGRGA